MNKIERAINRIYTILYTKFKEEKSSNGLKYLMLKPSGRSSQMIVSFAAFAHKGSRYNYIKTLKGFHCYRLFLLDEGASNGRGTYLLGDDKNEKTVDLINYLRVKYDIHDLYFIGSSKGGYCALDFAFKIPNAIPVIASPQYFVASYLNVEKTMPNLRAILNSFISDEGIKRIDLRLRIIISTSKIRPSKVYIHYSDQEHTYHKHIKYMLEDLSSAGIDVEEDVLHYPNHNDLIYYYPSYLKRILGSYIIH